jgi:dGTPase
MKWEILLNPNRPDGTSQVQPDHREQFERDYDRTVFSTPVRRMQDKTQVFPLDPNDSVRTRLTHSLEVSTVARGLARSVCLKLIEFKKIKPEMGRQIEAIASTCGLLHDLGNPPFGHAGEDAITGWYCDLFKKDANLRKSMIIGSQVARDYELFQGNAQTIRLITKLQILAGSSGLNLTFGTLSAALKYVSSSVNVGKMEGHEFSKLGYFTSENEIVERIREATGTGIYRNPISFLVEAADDLAYSVVDLEDGASKGIITWKQVKGWLASAIGAESSIYKSVMIGTYRALRIPEQDDEKYTDKNYLRAFRTAVIGLAVKAVTDKFVIEHDKILAGEYHKEIVYDSDVKELIRACKKIAKEHVFCDEPNLILELMGRNIISDLLLFFWEGVKSYDGLNIKGGFQGKIAALLSENYKEVFKRACTENSPIPIEYLRLQLVIDYVCGMTDSFARNLHRELKNC